MPCGGDWLAVLIPAHPPIWDKLVTMINPNQKPNALQKRGSNLIQAGVYSISKN